MKISYRSRRKGSKVCQATPIYAAPNTNTTAAELTEEIAACSGVRNTHSSRRDGTTPGSKQELGAGAGGGYIF